MPRNNKKMKNAPPPRPRGPGKPSAPASGPGKSQQHGGPKPGKNNANAPKKGPMQANQRPIVPFLRKDRVLLVGEGDFSFARSLATQYKCRNLCATCYDSKEELYAKYPQAPGHIEEILSAFPKKPTEDPDPVSNEEEEEDTNPKPKTQSKSKSKSPSPKVLFSVDARKLGSQPSIGKELRAGFPRRERKRPAWYQKDEPGPTYHPGGPWDVICFNFPHVGGLSTDVNRQVRANQELLVAFFKACVPLLSEAPPLMDAEDDEWVYEDGEGSEDEDFEDFEDEEEGEGGEGETAKDDESTGKGFRVGPGQILVTLFEGEPYTLWNIRDLARHAGLVVVTSFRFPWGSYGGEARMFVFEVKRKEDGKGKKGGKKRGRDDDSSDSE
ncbi:hypothetical protein N7461_007966 [Penicillium sp. DV-2018c]|nr:hypothetical protein N7461_007966 [Penicillium sp. DV-2018c]